MMSNQPSNQLPNHPAPSLGQRFFAWVTYKTANSRNERLDAHKRELFNSLSGAVLEIGPGTGANLDYYPQGIHWIGIEPNPAMHGYLRDKAEQSGLTAELRLGHAEQLDVPDCSVDVVVSTLVLCSVGSLIGSLAEVRRVLKPGGRFIFIEHVAAPQGSALRTVQNLVNPLWNVVADGCNLNRETWVEMERAGFASLTYERFMVTGGMSGLTPIIAGVAVKGGSQK